MNESYLAAAVQMNSGEDRAENVARATQLVEEAHDRGAQLVALPEMFSFLGRFTEIVAQAEPIPGPTSTAMGELARRLGITLLAGSICERSDRSGKGYNTSLLFSPQGELLARYRKMHLFDAKLPDGVCVHESRQILPGDETLAVATPLGVLGLSICYDLRFPELYRRLADQQAEVILVPSAFTETTGRDHWEVLLRARAIENQAYVIAPNQCGQHLPKLTTYGHTLIVDPWGKVLAEATTPEEVVLAEIDPALLQEIRGRLPVLAHRRGRQ